VSCNQRLSANRPEFPFQRILVTGSAGAGKTTVAKQLAAQLDLPYQGLDGIVWQPGWVKTPRIERAEHENAIASKAAWVVDGVSDVVLATADVVMFLDYPRRTCFWRVLWRNLPYLFRSRPGLPARCPELLIIPTLIRTIWRFPEFVRPKILQVRFDTSKQFIHIRSNEELVRLLEDLFAATWPVAAAGREGCSKQSVSTA